MLFANNRKKRRARPCSVLSNSKLLLLCAYHKVYALNSDEICVSPAANESEDQQKARFQVELEFVQCLANPNYLHCKYSDIRVDCDVLKLTVSLILVLAQRGFFKDSAFINYLKYLLYWKEPEYAKFLKYPMVSVLNFWKFWSF